MFDSTNKCDLSYFKSLVPGEFTYRNLPTLPSNLTQACITVFLLADSTPSGCLRCVKFIEDFLAENDGTSVTFMRIKVPYSISPLTYMSSDAFLHPEFDPCGTPILGRVKWLTSGTGGGDFSAYEVERLDIDEIEDDGMLWPVPYVPRLSHLKANGVHGNRPFLYPQLLSGLTYVQQFALNYAQERLEADGQRGRLPTIHEIACVGVSRFGDLPLQELVDQITQIAAHHADDGMIHVGALEVFRPKPEFSSVQCYARFPYHLIPRTSTWVSDCNAVLSWLIGRCQQQADRTPSQSLIHISPGKQTYCIGKCKVLHDSQSLGEQLERWFQLKIDEILVIKRGHIEAWMDPSSQAFKEREFLRMLFIPNQKSKRFFWQENEQGKVDMLTEMFPDEPETWIRHLMHLPVKRVGPEVFTFCIGDALGEEEDSAHLDGETGFVAYSHKTGRQLLEESLRQIQFKS